MTHWIFHVNPAKEYPLVEMVADRPRYEGERSGYTIRSYSADGTRIRVLWFPTDESARSGYRRATGVYPNNLPYHPTPFTHKKGS